MGSKQAPGEEGKNIKRAIMCVDEFTENRHNDKLVSKARSKPVVLVLNLLQER